VGTADLAQQLDALRSGRAFVDLTSWRKVRVGGTEAEEWLNDLLSAELSGLTPGRSVRSFLLSPTGRIRADLTVAGTGLGTMLLQDPIQPPIDELLWPYVLSSDVELADVTRELTLIGVPGAGRAPSPAETETLRPSCLGPGLDLLAPARLDADVRDALAGLVEASADAMEAWRIERGAARFGVDLGEASLPQEAGLDGIVAYQKGCFLGQEAMARVRNLGHPPFLLLAADGEGPARPGEAVLAGDQAVGTVTSAAALQGDGTAAIVRVRWGARDAELRTAGGTELRPTGRASGAA
jgi:folate-binding protein YgfZ